MSKVKPLISGLRTRVWNNFRI